MYITTDSYIQSYTHNNNNNNNNNNYLPFHYCPDSQCSI